MLLDLHQIKELHIGGQYIGFTPVVLSLPKAATL